MIFNDPDPAGNFLRCAQPLLFVPVALQFFQFHGQQGTGVLIGLCLCSQPAPLGKITLLQPVIAVPFQTLSLAPEKFRQLLQLVKLVFCHVSGSCSYLIAACSNEHYRSLIEKAFIFQKARLEVKRAVAIERSRAATKHR